MTRRRRAIQWCSYGALVLATWILWQVRFVPDGKIYVAAADDLAQIDWEGNPIFLSAENGESTIWLETAHDKQSYIRKRYAAEPGQQVRVRSVAWLEHFPAQKPSQATRMTVTGRNADDAVLMSHYYAAWQFAPRETRHHIDAIITVPEDAVAFDFTTFAAAGSGQLKIAELEVVGVQERVWWKGATGILILAWLSRLAWALPHRRRWVQVAVALWLLICGMTFAFPRIINVPRPLASEFWMESPTRELTSPMPQNEESREVATKEPVVIDPRVEKAPPPPKKPTVYIEDQKPWTSRLKHWFNQSLAGRFFLHTGIAATFCLPFLLFYQRRTALKWCAIVFVLAELVPLYWYGIWESSDWLDLIAYAVGAGVAILAVKLMMRIRIVADRFGEINLVGARGAN